MRGNNEQLTQTQHSINSKHIQTFSQKLIDLFSYFQRITRKGFFSQINIIFAYDCDLWSSAHNLNLIYFRTWIYNFLNVALNSVLEKAILRFQALWVAKPKPPIWYFGRWKPWTTCVCIFQVPSMMLSDGRAVTKSSPDQFTCECC